MSEIGFNILFCHLFLFHWSLQLAHSANKTSIKPFNISRTSVLGDALGKDNKLEIEADYLKNVFALETAYVDKWYGDIGQSRRGNEKDDDLTPNDFRNIFSGRDESVDEIAKRAFAALRVTSRLAREKNISKNEVAGRMATLQLPEEMLQTLCPDSYRSAGKNIDLPPEGPIYREADGTYNNPLDGGLGKSQSPFHRLLPPDFSDGIESFRLGSDGGPLPNARTISLLIHSEPQKPTKLSEFRDISLFMTQWAQFLIHDFTLTPLSKVARSKCCIPENELNPNCAPIPIFSNDPFYSSFGLSCMEFTRSSPAFRQDCSLGPKETLNQVTAYLDASVIYGSTQNTQNLLRSFRYGQLKVRDKIFFDDEFDFLPLNPNGTQRGCVDELCYMAGDVRVNENPSLTAIHVLWLREHNRIARILQDINPDWDDEKVFQETRRFVTAEYQHITFGEYLPIVLGQKILNLYPDLKIEPWNSPSYYNGYSPDISPAISQVFSTAAFRFGHSMVADKMIYIQSGPSFNRETPTYLREGYFRPRLISGKQFAFGPENIIQGILYQKSYIMDNLVTPELTNRLYQTKPHVPGLDIMALDIQRGRDHGLPPYNQWRIWCGLEPMKSFDDLAKVMPTHLIEKYQNLYASVDDIDLISAGISEYWIYDAIVGPTFACLITEQFMRTRRGDRFWYENVPSPNQQNGPTHLFNPFTIEQLSEIKKTTMSAIICDNMFPYINEIQPNAFKSPLASLNNQLVPCSNIDRPDLIYWKE